MTLHPEIAAVIAGESEGCIVTGDCLEIMADMPDGCVDAVVTDPPYGIAIESHGQNFLGARTIAGDGDTALLEWTWAWAKSMGCPLVMFFSPYRPVGEWRSVLVWAKGAHVGGGGDIKTCWKRDLELIGVARNHALNGPRDSSVLRFNALSPPPTGHVAEKPVPLMTYLIGKTSSPGDIIVDPFCGSGTTCVAAKKLGRKFIGIELVEKYADIARERIERTPAPRIVDGVEREVKGKSCFF